MPQFAAYRPRQDSVTTGIVPLGCSLFDPFAVLHSFSTSRTRPKIKVPRTHENGAGIRHARTQTFTTIRGAFASQFDLRYRAAVRSPAARNCNSVSSAVFTPAVGNGKLLTAFGDAGRRSCAQPSHAPERPTDRRIVPTTRRARDTSTNHRHRLYSSPCWNDCLDTAK